jgi:flagellar M-ring protein FliF
MRTLIRHLLDLARRWRAIPAAVRWAAGGLALILLAGGVVWSLARPERPPPAAARAGVIPEGRRLLAEQREIEGVLEQNIVELLERALGRGAVVAKVSVTLDRREVESTADSYDPDNTVVRSESELAQKSYEVGKTTTRIISRSPRLQRLSAAVLVAGEGGAPRADLELQRLGALAKHAVGFDPGRGDRFEISSAPFAGATAAAGASVRRRWEVLSYAGLGVLALAVLLAAARLIWGDRRRSRRPSGQPPSEAPASAVRPDPLTTRDKARRLVEADPARAAHLLRAWIAVDGDLKDHRA